MQISAFMSSKSGLAFLDKHTKEDPSPISEPPLQNFLGFGFFPLVWMVPL
jgi:hypothetical protein